jgi:hypothetical protein
MNYIISYLTWYHNLSYQNEEGEVSHYVGYQMKFLPISDIGSSEYVSISLFMSTCSWSCTILCPCSLSCSCSMDVNMYMNIIWIWSASVRFLQRYTLYCTYIVHNLAYFCNPFIADIPQIACAYTQKFYAQSIWKCNYLKIHGKCISQMSKVFIYFMYLLRTLH